MQSKSGDSGGAVGVHSGRAVGFLTAVVLSVHSGRADAACRSCVFVSYNEATSTLRREARLLTPLVHSVL